MEQVWNKYSTDILKVFYRASVSTRIISDDFFSSLPVVTIIKPVS